MNLFCRCLAASVFVFSGCHTQYFHTETTLSPNGSIERAILQPKSGTPRAVQEPADWDTIGWTSEKSFADFQGGIRDLKLDEDESDYFAAWIRVDSVDQLPIHYRKFSTDESVSSYFERRFEKRDYGLLTEFVWQETLTDVVTLEGFRKARQEIIDLLCEVAEPTLEQSLGDEHDTSKLMDWLRNEGTAFVNDVSDALYDVASSKVRPASGESLNEEIEQRFIRICQQHGMTEPLGEDGTFNDKAAVAVLTEILQKTVTRRDGKPLGKDVIRGLLGATGFSKKDQKSPLARQLVKSWKRVVAARDGGREGFKKELEKLATRILGVHSGFLLSSPDNFRFVMSFPGVVVETNGVLLADDQVRWQFAGTDAWPSGFSMTGRSLLDNSGGVKGLQRWQSKLSRASLTRLLDLVAGDERLVEVLRECRKAGDLAPLDEFIDSFDDADVVAVARKVRRLLNGK